MKILELFKGSGSIGKAAKRLGYTEIVSLDIDSKYSPDIVSDIMDWDYKNSYPPGYFDIIWASPPCTYYSTLQYAMMYRPKGLGTEGLELKRKESDKIVSRVLEIVEYFRPKYWYMENPQTGALKSRDVVRGLPYVDADYCKYGFPYRKRTRFWTNRNVQLSKCARDCLYMADDGTRHRSSVGKVPQKGYDYECLKELGFDSLEARYSIPQPLLLQLLPPVPKKVVVTVRRN